METFRGEQTFLQDLEEEEGGVLVSGEKLSQTLSHTALLASWSKRGTPNPSSSGTHSLPSCSCTGVWESDWWSGMEF